MGCVIIKNNKLVGVGSTSEKGRPHAEENAINMADKAALGATLYVSLEPCNINNNALSCVNKIIKAGIKRVVFSILDPNKKTFNNSVKFFKKNGIEAEQLKPEFNNFLINYAHFCYHKLRRPMVALKLATSVNGKIASFKNKSRWITSKLARKHVHQVRSFYDAIIIGSRTVQIDDPTLNVRISGFKKKITRVILDTNLKIKSDAKLIKTSYKDILIIFCDESSFKKNENKIKLLKEKGIQIYKIAKIANGRGLNVIKVIKKLHKLGYQKLLVEGGSKLAYSFIKNHLVDYFYHYKSDKFLNSTDLDMINVTAEVDNFLFMYNKLKLEDNNLDIWLNKNIRQAYKKI